MELLNKGCDWLLTGAVIVLAVLIIVSLIRSVRGPRIADRIIAVNMIGTMVILILAILSVYLEESYLVDVCLIYAMISFLGVVVLCKVYTGVYLQKKQMQADLNAVEDNLRRQEKRDDMAGSAARAETLKKEERL
ncbi:MAG: sodium:proton antiporter [Lachnospiraceae bacterium]|jgi:Multisubunit Na+/H+ antiporter, MnhF subunit|nr:sodium:proton antiporter [Lachnospiraceae bacterium]